MDGAPHTAKTTVNLCVYGVPLATYIKDGGRRRPAKGRRYALEAIINDIIYLRVHNYVYVPCYNCYGSRVCNNTRLGGRLICTCGIINGKKYS